MDHIERIQYAKSMFQEYPEEFTQECKRSILAGVISLGMSPIEAKLAGGSFFYQVSADRKHWPEHADPMDVMWAQSKSPDDSEIRMTFNNDTQFSGRVASFNVYFEHGRAVSIHENK